MSQQNLYLFVLECLQKGQNPATICKQNNISKQKLNYYIRKLKKDNLIKKVGYGTWNVVKTSKKQAKDTQKLQEIRGHAYIWKIRIPRGVMTKWRTRLVALQIPYKVTGIHKVPMIEISGRKVLLGEKHIVIYETEGFIGEDARICRINAIYELKDLLSKIEVNLNINLQPHLFTVRREHYAIMNNLLAQHYNDKKQSIKVKDINGYWLITDKSLNTDELENIGQQAFDINIPMQNWWNDHKDKGFKITPSFILETLNGHNEQIKQVTENQIMFAKNIEEHMKVLKDMRTTLKDIRDDLKND